MGEKHKQFGKVGVLMGGYSSERQISIKSGTAVYEALNSVLDNVVLLDIVEKDPGKISEFIKHSEIDVAFIALHGEMGEDGVIQDILTENEIFFTGSGSKASALAVNKISSQSLFSRNGIRVPLFFALKEKDSWNDDDIFKAVGSFPYVIKPACEGSSLGIKFVKNHEEMKVAVADAFKYGDGVLVEQFISGRELTVGILENVPLPVIEIFPKNSFFDYESKYEEGRSNYLIPADLSDCLTDQIQGLALQAHDILGCSDFSRVDFILDENMDAYILEVNTIPGFTSTSLLPKAAQKVGINFDQLCLKLLGLAYGKTKKSNQDITANN